MRIVDDTGRLWRAPEVKFEADEIDLEAFGYNIANRDLVAALEQRARGIATLQLIDDEVTAVEPGDDCSHGHARSGGDACKRRLSSAPTAAIRCAARRPASAPTNATTSKSRSRFA